MEQNLSIDTNKDYHLFIEDALIKAKGKEVQAEKAMNKAAIMFFVILASGIIYVLYRLNFGGAVFSQLTFLLVDGILILWIIALFVSLYHFQNKSKYFEKKEKDFKELKEDVIDRAADIWYSTQLEQKRLEKYHELNNKYDINLFHK